MKKILTAAIALGVLATTATAGAAGAQPYRGGDNRYEQRYDRDGRGGPRADNRYERRAERSYARGKFHHPRGYEARRWHRGDRLPAAYRGNAYRVDYRHYRLAPPPRGYESRRVGDDVVLTAIATGVITSVLIGLFN